MDKGEYCGVVLVDMSKAFDRVRHELLLKVAVWVQRVKKQSFDFLYFFTGSVLCMVQRVYPENLSVIGCFLPEI